MWFFIDLVFNTRHILVVTSTDILISVLATFNTNSYLLFFIKGREKEGRKDPLKRQEGSEIALSCFFPVQAVVPSQSHLSLAPFPTPEMLLQPSYSDTVFFWAEMPARVARQAKPASSWTRTRGLWEQCDLTLWAGAHVCSNPAGLGKKKPSWGTS